MVNRDRETARAIKLEEMFKGDVLNRSINNALGSGKDNDVGRVFVIKATDDSKTKEFEDMPPKMAIHKEIRNIRKLDSRHEHCELLFPLT